MFFRRIISENDWEQYIGNSTGKWRGLRRVVWFPFRISSGRGCFYYRAYSGPRLSAILTSAERLTPQTRGRILPGTPVVLSPSEDGIFVLYTSISAEMRILSLQRFSGPFLHHNYTGGAVAVVVKTIRSLRNIPGATRRLPFPIFTIRTLLRKRDL